MEFLRIVDSDSVIMQETVPLKISDHALVTQSIYKEQDAAEPSKSIDENVLNENSASTSKLPSITDHNDNDSPETKESPNLACSSSRADILKSIQNNKSH